MCYGPTYPRAPVLWSTCLNSPIYPTGTSSVWCAVCVVSLVTRQHMCRYRRVHSECGWLAAEWQFKFSYLLSQVMPQVFDAAYHPSTQQSVDMNDAEMARQCKISPPNFFHCAPNAEVFKRFLNKFWSSQEVHFNNKAQSDL